MEPGRITHRAIRFGAFELDLRAGELRKQGVKIKLQEQPFQILAMLLEHPGQVITREELRNKLWLADTFVDLDHSLNKAINKLREALGDSPDNPVFIETLPKRGYRFTASLDGARSEVQVRGGPIDSIAVFPFEKDSIDPDTECLAVGIPGSIIHSLSQIPRLHVISWRTTSSAADQQSDPLAIGRELGARTVLTGRIWQRANKLRLHVDLLDTANGEEIWGDQYDRSLAELFAVQDDISREVSQTLRLKMTGEAENRLTKRYTENIQAYQLYVRARRCVEKRSAEGFKPGRTAKLLYFLTAGGFESHRLHQLCLFNPKSSRALSALERNRIACLNFVRRSGSKPGIIVGKKSNTCIMRPLNAKKASERRICKKLAAGTMRCGGKSNHCSHKKREETPFWNPLP